MPQLRCDLVPGTSGKAGGRAQMRLVGLDANMKPGAGKSLGLVQSWV